MSDRNTDQDPGQGGGLQVNYRPSYCAEPQPQMLHYPGMQYQLYPAALAGGAQRQPRAPRRRKRVTVLAACLLVLLSVLMAGFRMFDWEMPAERDPQRTLVRQPTLAASLTGSASFIDEASPGSSLVPPSPQAAAALPVGSKWNTEDMPAVPAAPPAEGAANVADMPAMTAAPSASSESSLPDTPVARAALPVRTALNLPDVLPARDTERLSPAAGDQLAAKGLGQGRSVNTVPPQGRPAAQGAAGCSEALRAMGLCGVQGR